MSFPKLGKNPEFQKVYQSGRSKANRYLVMYVLKDQEGMTRYGFSVSKKVGNSVVRHHVTGLLREAVRSCDNFVMEGNRIIIIARPSVREKNLEDIKDSIRQLYKLHGIWRSV